MINLFPNKTKPYFIVTPPYNHYSAGVRALHLLCHSLNQSGQRAYVTFSEQPSGNQLPVNPLLNTPWRTPETDMICSALGEPIVVYPDIIKGNPLGGRKVVRWLLGYPGVCGGDTTFPETDNIWSYSTKIAKSQGSDKVLYMPVVDPDIFYKPTEGKREGACYYAKKSKEIWGTEISIPEGSKNLEGTPQQIADILRSSEMCHIYEDSSVILEAMMCGCPIMYHHNARFTHIHAEDDWSTDYPILLQTLTMQLSRFINETQKL